MNYCYPIKKYYKHKLTEDGEVSGDAAVAALTDIDTKINAYRLIEVSLAQKVRMSLRVRPWTFVGLDCNNCIVEKANGRWFTRNCK